MASRDDIDILWHLSPRIVLVKAPSDELTVQDLHDTVRDIESRPENLIYDGLIATAGGENLGGGVTVGLTSTLQNARIAFEANKTFVTSGIISTTDATGNFLIDSNNTFSGINPGSWILNLTDGSIATVYTVDSNTQLRTDFLGGGDDNQFEIGDWYKIIEVDQKEVAGGNLVAIDENDADLEPLLPTAGNQVVRTSASSATQRSSEQLEFSTFEGRIWINTDSPYSGTKYPAGTPGYPVNNLVDAHTISEARGIQTFGVFGSLLIGDGIVLSDGHVFIGYSPVVTTITIQSSADVSNCEFQNSTVQGIFDGNSIFRECVILDVTYVNGFIYRCALGGTITMGGTSPLGILSCYSNFPGPANRPTIDFNGGGQNLALRDYYGGIELINCTVPTEVSMDMSAATVILDSSVTDGTFLIRGDADIINNSSVIPDDRRPSVLAADAVWDEPIADHTDTSTFGGWVGKKVLTVAKFLGLK